MDPSAASKNILFTVHRASNLPQNTFRHFKRKEYHASISVADQQRQTAGIRDANPEWEELFALNVHESSTVLVRVFHKNKLTAQTEINVAQCFQPGFQGLGPTQHELLSAGSSTKLEGASLTISWSLANTTNEQVGLERLAANATKSGSISTPAAIDAHKLVVPAALSIAKSDSFETVMGLLSKFVQIGDAVAEVHPYAKVAWSIITSAQRVLEAQQERDGKVRELWDIVLDTLDFMRHAEPLKAIQGFERTVQSIMKQIYECILFLRNYGERGFAARTIQDSITTKADDTIQQFISAFEHLKQCFRDRVDTDQWKIASATKDGVLQLVTVADRLKDIAESTRLGELPGAKLSGVQWDPHRACLPKTREKILLDIVDWVNNPDPAGDKIMWLSGAAGTGKSSISNSVAELFDSLGRLGASFRFDRSVATPDTPSQLFGNLCHQLATFDGRLRDAVLSAMDGGAGGSMSCNNQAKHLLVGPCTKAQTCGPVLIVIDALDESGDDTMDVKTSRKDLVQAIVEEFPKLPSSIKVLITSREEGSISLLMPQCRSCLRKNTGDLENTENDIRKFIQARMDAIRIQHGKPSEWPGATRMQKLASYADGLFICADVACKFIADSDDPEVNLQDLLADSADVRAGAEGNLDRLFLSVIGQKLPIGIPAGPLEEQTYRNWHYVVDSIVTLRIPLTFQEMDLLLGLSSNRTSMVLMDGRLIKLTTTRTIISNLRPILRIDGELKEAVRLLHKSVYDYLTGRVDPPIRVDVSSHNANIAMQCLEFMKHHLRRDICDIGDACLLNSEVVDLPIKIRHQIPEVLRYSCRHFVQHLNNSGRRDSILLTELVEFLTKRLLQWIEVMGLLDELDGAEDSLHSLAGYLKAVEHIQSDIAQVVEDAISLLRNFRNAIKLSTLHIYISAVMFLPRASMLYEHYSHMNSNRVYVTSSHPFWTSSLRTLEGHTGSVYSIVFSPDGKKLASASSDKTVRLWDVESGTAIRSALEGHTRSVGSFVFSPDGKKLVSASYDKTVRLWDVESGIAVGSALEGHTSEANSVVFSPDGKKLVFALRDNTARLWDVASGSTIGSALEGHTSGVTSAVFSPDGKKLASASTDGTLRLWDVESGTAIGSVLEGHTNLVCSVVFSPDGKKLASAAYDNTVRLWDVESGTTIGSALEGHTNGVNSVVFSPDGKKLASASYDHTVRLWDVESGTAIGYALKGHTSSVGSVVFSPDGKKLASASFDNTVRLWVVESGTAIRSALEGHTSGVTSAVFSPDGKKLASASFDKTVRLWDVESSTAIGSSLERHNSSVYSVVFSPDGKKLASASTDGTVRLWDVESGTVIGSALEGHTGYVNSVVFSPDGKNLASASNDNTVKLWDVELGTAIGSALKGHTSKVTSVVFSPDGKKLASTSWDYTVRMWDVESGTAIGSALKGHTDWVYSVVFSPDGKNLASASNDNTARLWDADSGTAIGSALEGHTGYVNSVVFSPDGKKLASASNDHTVRLWDVESGTAIGSALKGHTDWVYSVVFSPDGKKLASGSYNNTVRLWDVETGQLNDVKDDQSMGSIFSYHNGSSDTPSSSINVGSEAPTRRLYISAMSFLKNSKKSRMIWIPAHLRGDEAVSCGHTTVINGSSGAMTFLQNFEI